MRTIAVLGAIGAIFLGLGGTASAHGFTAGRALLGASALAQAVDPVASCPAGVPVQTITVINDANVRPVALAKVERAMVDQSMQLRAAWGTPCVQFGTGGWPLYLEPNVNGWKLHYAPDDTGAGTFEDHTACSHRPDLSMPCALVAVTDTWTIDTSHEVAEMLVDPSAQGDEVCDPVEDYGYRIGGVWVSDFVTPAWYGRGTGPYDRMGVVSRAGQTAS